MLKEIIKYIITNIEPFPVISTHELRGDTSCLMCVFMSIDKYCKKWNEDLGQGLKIVEKYQNIAEPELLISDNGLFHTINMMDYIVIICLHTERNTHYNNDNRLHVYILMFLIENICTWLRLQVKLHLWQCFWIYNYVVKQKEGEETFSCSLIHQGSPQLVHPNCFLLTICYVHAWPLGVSIYSKTKLDATPERNTWKIM